jgi:hypothetical protein
MAGRGRASGLFGELTAMFFRRPCGDSVTVLNHLQTVIDLNDQRYSELARLTQRAIDIANENTRHWQENANEWRGALNDRNETFIPKNEHNQKFAEVERQINELRLTYSKDHEEMLKRFEHDEGRRGGVQAAWVFVGGLVGLILGMCAIYAFLSSHLAK